MASAFLSQSPRLRGWAGWFPLLPLPLPLFRVLIAATDFEPGDFVFREKELVVGAN